MTKTFSKLALAAVIGLSFSTADKLLYGQSGISNARSVAMGGAYTAIARGVESPSWNPANLGLSGKNKYHFNLVSVGLGLNNNSFDKNHYDLYNGKYLTAEDKQNILAAIPTEGLRFDLGTEVQAMGLAFGPLAFNASGFAVSDLSFSKEILDLVLNGNEFGRVYNIGDTGGEGWAASSFGVSLGMPIIKNANFEFAVGGSIKYLRGFAYAKVKEATTTMSTDFDGLQTNGRVVIDRAFGGSGFAIDVGTAARSGNWSLSLGLSNISNNINWNKKTKRFVYEFSADSVSVEKIANSDIDSVFSDSEETVAIEPFTTKLPAELRFGIARATKRFTFGVDFRKAFKEAPGVSTKPKFALGAELRLIHFFPLRSGVAFGGKQGFTPSAGFAFDFSVFSWDFAVASPGGFSGKGLAFAYNWMFRF
ncbi:hypothetical protein IH922_04295 [candidate division KSB1 bacterium]|nr:hypothetical protein [candidate division KSB1 bacterium]